MAILTRKDILTADDIKRELVPVPEWGGDVYVRGLTGAEVDKFSEASIKQRGKNQVVNMEGIRARLVSMSICDENGKRLFTDADVTALSGKSSAALIRLFKIAQRLSGLGEEDVEELAEGLEADPSGASPSD